MIIRLAIIGAVLLLGGVIFSSQINEIVTRSIDSVSERNPEVGSALEEVDEKIHDGIDTVNTRLGDLASDSNEFVSEKLEKIESGKILEDP